MLYFRLPTYLAQHLGFASDKAAGIYTGATLIILLTAFISVFVYERLGRNCDKTSLVMFVSSALFFALTYFVSHSVFNIVFIVLANLVFASAVGAIGWGNLILVWPGLVCFGVIVALPKASE